MVLALGTACPEPECNLSACVSRSAVAFYPGPCPVGLERDFLGNPRQLRFRDGSVGCSIGAMGFYVPLEGGHQLPVYDRKVACEVVEQLCPWADPTELPAPVSAP